ncbi:TetR/AcrR family transcriptional regulator C-terminal domain-containing protein [Clostridium paridis]|uniref:TetR/AcrR family transcriptional regulator C-terminal domain-containing protein n=1 Tax=Clostridium paridis TaxID=2803863 RepID=A0A937FHH7_9CLOT|nr:TetR/AcrR family transcriptional regulator C-terminal domain-containing protein [Clostridium paridis]MBL4933248.1 TetR/AcrR family transcriptional regulator C-terminal domain-containing protein [Clostridium paridis]
MKQKAKAAIIESFKELLNKKSIDKITVKEICEHCNVNRQTFYNHFTDIMDIFKYIFFKELSMDIAQNRTFETWSGGFLATMNYLKKNSKMILHVYNSSYLTEANTFFISLSNRLLDDVVEECVKKMEVKLNDKDRSFIVNFYRHVFNGLMTDWVNEGMEEEPEIILKKLLVMITGSIPRSVSAFVKEEIK